MKVYALNFTIDFDIVKVILIKWPLTFDIWSLRVILKVIFLNAMSFLWLIVKDFKTNKGSQFKHDTLDLHIVKVILNKWPLTFKFIKGQGHISLFFFNLS